MSWNFILGKTIAAKGDESSLYSRINYVHSPDGNFMSGNNKRVHIGLARTRIGCYANA